MKNFLKRVIPILLAGVLCTTLFTGCVQGVKYDETKTQLFIANYAGGVGVKWLEDVKTRFEAEYSDYKGEGDKVGVEVIISNEKEYEGQSIHTTMARSTQEIYFTSNAQYYDYVSLARDVTSLLKDTVGSDGKTIYSKMTEEDKAAMEVNGKYYGIPHYEYDDGISYDAGVFEAKKFYFADAIDEGDTTYPGTRRFIVNANTKKSCGPDGEYGTYDDGLPSSYQEFYKLIDKMSKNDTYAFVWSGQLVHYTLIMTVGLSNNYLGANGLKACFTFDSNGEEIEIVTGFDANNRPIIQDTVITEDNGYLLKQSAANYYAIELATKIFNIGSGYYDEDCTAGTMSHLGAMELFANSGLDGEKYDAMIIEGSYWHNEGSADGIFTRLAEDYPETYTKKDIRWMPLPRQYDGTVTEGKGTPPVFSGAGNGYCFINNNIKEHKVDLAEKFISFCYTDEELVNFTKATNGITKRLNYDYLSVMDDVNSFGKSLLEHKKAAVEGGSYVIPVSTSSVYKQNTKLWSRNNTSGYWDSTISNQKYAYVYTAARQSKSARSYFEGMKMTEAQWNTYLSK